MTFEELNIVRKIKKQVTDEEMKLQALKDCAISITPQFKRETYIDEQGKLRSFTCLDNSPKSGNTDSRIEKIVVKIVDSERNLEKLKIGLESAKLHLTEKICEEYQEATEQAILLYHYVSCRSFREIAHIMHYTLRYIYKIHERILNNLCGSVQLDLF